MSHDQVSIRPANVGVGAGEEEERAPKSGWRKVLVRAGDWLAYKDKGEWLKDMTGSLSMTASIIATMTFQLATNPPGGVLQASANDIVHNCTSSPCPGEAVLAIVYRDDYLKFLVCNTISFIASLSVCLLLVSGIPLNHRFPVWLLSVGMWIAITSLALTYAFAGNMVTPDPIWRNAYAMFSNILTIWAALLGIVGVFLFTLLYVWGVNKCIEKRN